METSAGLKRDWFPFSLLLAISLLAPPANGQTGKGGFPFAATLDFPGLEASGKVEKGKPFGLLFCLQAFDAGIEQIEMALRLPSEVQNLGGETSWKGELRAREENCLNIGLRSRTEMVQWRRPVHARVRFIFGGMAVTREFIWTDKGLEDTGFVAK